MLGERIWRQIIDELYDNLSKAKLDPYQLYKAYVCMTKVYSAGMQLADQVLEAWVQRGFDSDELIELGPQRSIRFIEKLAFNKPGLDNQIFLMHLRSYAKALRKQF